MAQLHKKTNKHLFEIQSQLPTKKKRLGENLETREPIGSLKAPACPRPAWAKLVGCRTAI
jgi:hypothetical protein